MNRDQTNTSKPKENLFGSVRSSRNANLRSFVQVRLELLIFIILAQILKLTSCALSEINQSTQRVIREQSERNQRAINRASK